jgi:acyl-CoA thioester hydrolase
MTENRFGAQASGLSVDPVQFSEQWRVRQYELDSQGHVNNAVYLNYAEQVAIDHAEAAGFGLEFNRRHGGAWVVHRHQITYHRPAGYGDELRVTTRVETLGGVRATRRTTIQRASDEVLLAEAVTEWTWVRLSDGRPTRIPGELVALYTAAHPSA